ncbi:histone H4 transcription factor isoform X1 [Diorhabda sublineata]|uniref:histone H4 transcription factor isoform X1 n=1 Tax=Diorhabda sublineata TaxID=1163346 RepID=UPI0024E07311|nr:histone H4 transcription factor isoform X1 [Diorhabda sublineata]
MEEQEEYGKRKNKLAVFEHVVQNEKPSKIRKLITLNSEDSQSELVIDEPVSPIKRKKRSQIVKLSEERLNLECKWGTCNEIFNCWENFNTHLVKHATDSSEDLVCQWIDCDTEEIESVELLMQHLSFHGYLSKLKNIGDNVATREKLPKCTESYLSVLPSLKSGYECEWQHCTFSFWTIFDFLNHMNVHIKNNPKMAKNNEVIECCWNACNTKYATQTKLADHLKTHTKEKIMGCANCNRLFSNKTKFCDHRKRQKTQLSTALQTYQCSQCVKLFPTERLLRDHMRSHVNHYKCTMCDMTCSKPSVLAKHIRFKHIDFKPYRCPNCDKRFVEKYNLNTHLKIHEEENPLKCYLCEFECRSKVGMDNHCVKMHDSVGSVYECHCCKKRYKRGTYLTTHLTEYHDYRWPSGHTRFRYRKDEDGIHRLQTVRYESLEVTQDLIRSESMQASGSVKEAPSYNFRYDSDSKTGYVVHITDEGKENADRNDGGDRDGVEENVMITINDLDEEGNIMKCEVVQSKLIPMDQLPDLDYATPVDVNPVVETKLEAIDKTEEIETCILDYQFFKNT